MSMIVGENELRYIIRNDELRPILLFRVRNAHPKQGIDLDRLRLLVYVLEYVDQVL